MMGKFYTRYYYRWLLFWIISLSSQLQAQVPVLTVQDQSFLTTLNEKRELLVSPDHQYLLSYTLEGNHSLWDIKTGRLIRVFQPPMDSSPLLSLVSDGFFKGPSISNDNNYLLTEAGAKNGFLLWDINTGKVLKSLSHNKAGDSVDYNYAEIRPDNFITTHGTNRTNPGYEFGARHLETGEEIAFTYDPIALWGDSRPLGCITALSKDLKVMALGTKEGAVFLFKLKKKPDESS